MPLRRLPGSRVSVRTCCGGAIAVKASRPSSCARADRTVPRIGHPRGSSGASNSRAGVGAKVRCCSPGRSAFAGSTIYAVLRRLGLQRLRVFDPPRPRFRRYERPIPGDLVHIDTKKVGRLPEGGGKRFGRLGRDRRHGAGWEYVHVAVDDRTRVQYSERLGSERAEDCAAFTVRALRFFLDHGVRVRQVMTDNYWSYTKSPAFAAVLASVGVEHIRTPKYAPRWNGKAEAFIGMLLKRWAYARPYSSNRARAIAFQRFGDSYNHRRPHGELGGLTPMQRLAQDLVNNVRGQYS